MQAKRDRALFRAMALQTGGRPGTVLTCLAFHSGLLMRLVQSLGVEELAGAQEGDSRYDALASKLREVLHKEEGLRALYSDTGVTEDEAPKVIMPQLVRVAQFALLDKRDPLEQNINAVENLIRSGRAELFVS